MISVNRVLHLGGDGSAGACPPRSARWACLALVAWLTVVGGCQRTPDLQFVSSQQVLDLSPELQDLVRQTLAQHTGSATQPRLLGASEATQRRVNEGAAIYAQRCQHCHGVTGDGNGPAAPWLNPKPRDYRRGIFKFTSTPYGAKPRREDLLRTVRRGVTGTSMPAFNLLSNEELDAVVDYVLTLTHRGELETFLAAEAESSEELPDDIVAEYVDGILTAWRDADGQAVQPLTPMPAQTEESVARGKELFLTKGCAKCHGEDGRGMTSDNVGVDAWGNSTRAADLTSGMLHGGTQPVDIYRRIYSGINGTPMPSFQAVFPAEPDTFWYLVHYVLAVSNRRREGELPAFSRPRTLAELAQAGSAMSPAAEATPAEDAAEAAGEPASTEATAEPEPAETAPAELAPTESTSEPAPEPSGSPASEAPAEAAPAEPAAAPTETAPEEAAPSEAPEAAGATDEPEASTEVEASTDAPASDASAPPAEGQP